MAHDSRKRRPVSRGCRRRPQNRFELSRGPFEKEIARIMRNGHRCALTKLIEFFSVAHQWKRSEIEGHLSDGLGCTANADLQRHTVRCRSDPHNFRAKFYRAGLGRGRSAFQSDSQQIAQGILALTAKTHPSRRNIKRHRFLKPRNILRTNANRHSQRSARAAATLGIAPRPVSVRDRADLRLELNCQRKMRRGRAQAPASHHPSRHFRLAVAKRSVIRKSHPERDTGCMRFHAREQQAAARNVFRLY